MCKRKIHRVVNYLQILYLALAHYHHLSIWWTVKANEKSLADMFLIGCFAWNVQFSRLNFSLALHLSYYVTGRHDGKNDTLLLVKLRLFLDFPFHSALCHIFLIHSFSSEGYNDHETTERSSQTNVLVLLHTSSFLLSETPPPSLPALLDPVPPLLSSHYSNRGADRT